MLRLVVDFWPVLVTVATIVIAVWASGHVVLYKRDVRAAVGWAGLIWLAPLVGALLYLLLGINRIQRRAHELRGEHRAFKRPPAAYLCSARALAQAVEPAHHLIGLAGMIGRVTGQPLLQGNVVVPLLNGDQAYPEMLQAIDQAQISINLSTYIFDNDRMGRRFLRSLQRAVERGVEVRVLIDDVGARYTLPPITGSLRRAGVPVARFLRTLIPGRMPYANLRNHRKILVADGRVGFTGGMNIREGHVLNLQPPPRHPVRDLHFRIEGPVLMHLQETFADDWAFSTGEVLDGERWFPPPAGMIRGSTIARGVSDGPDEDFDKLRMTLLGALAAAQSSVRVVTPYFLPDAALITSLNVAAMRGVTVDVLLPERNNLRLIQWASTAQLWQILQRGCRVWLTPPPFDHSKLMVVDRTWVLLGSANWDPRSLRLNFEFNVECYDPALGGSLDEHVEEKCRAARPITLAEVDARRLPIRLRDGVARLASPYL
jgi:cardiolipin synthase A/B